MLHRRLVALLVVSSALLTPFAADAQVIGTFRWRTEPFCNVLNLTVTQTGTVFTLNGFDEPCGGNPRLPVHGVAVLQPNGSVTIGLSVISLPGGAPVSLEADINIATVSGTWRDSVGRTGPFMFNPSGTAGSPRPLEQTLHLTAYGAVGQGFTFGHGCMILDIGPNTDVNLNIPLPARAIITAVRARYRDQAAAADMSIALYQVTGFVGGASASTGSASVAFTTSGQTLGDVANLQLFANLAPVSDSTMYYLSAFSAQSAQGLQLCGASVDYRLQ